MSRPMPSGQRMRQRMNMRREEKTDDGTGPSRRFIFVLISPETSQGFEWQCWAHRHSLYLGESRLRAGNSPPFQWAAAALLILYPGKRVQPPRASFGGSLSQFLRHCYGFHLPRPLTIPSKAHGSCSDNRYACQATFHLRVALSPRSQDSSSRPMPAFERTS
ncbi:hypothetical protein F5Y17DRAFT_369340 [Xylariaceae sp. FL0594]|nr:hypothetical protein F5Y17DRAFT_369340 [Xylariaceae sp. FL0594]